MHSGENQSCNLGEYVVSGTCISGLISNAQWIKTKISVVILECTVEKSQNATKVNMSPVAHALSVHILKCTVEKSQNLANSDEVN